MGSWRESPPEWPFGMPPPDSDGWHGWAVHWLSAHILPLWLYQAAVEARLRPSVMARLGWRLYGAQGRALERAAGEGGALRQSLSDAGLPREVVSEVLGFVEEDLEGRRRRMVELEAVGRHL